MKISHLFLILLPFVPFFGLFAPMTAMPESFDPGYLRFTTPLFLLCFIFYAPANWLAHGVWFFFPDLGIPSYLRYLLYPACLLQSSLISFLVWRFFRACWSRQHEATDFLHRDA